MFAVLHRLPDRGARLQSTKLQTQLPHTLLAQPVTLPATHEGTHLVDETVLDTAPAIKHTQACITTLRDASSLGVPHAPTV
jgi:hypothetical protein